MTAIEQSGESIMITDADGDLQYVNPAFVQNTGYTCEEALGKNPRFLQSGKQDSAFYQLMWKTLLAGETWSGQVINQKKDGTFVIDETTISPVKDSLGKIVNYVAIKLDITERDIREKQIRQSQKMESVGRLAGGVAHDFNNILQAIIGFCELLIMKMDAQPEQQKDVLEIKKAAKHAGSLVQQLLAFSREQPTECNVLDLNAVLSGAEKMFRQVIGEKAQLEFKLDSDLKPLVADASQILQIALNLIVNAKDAMGSMGQITLSTQNMRIKKEDLRGRPNAQSGCFVCLSVEDSGCGMNQSQLIHLFEPFFTTKQQGQGTGLGLSVVYGIVKEHGGWIDVDSELGKGSAFKIFLPAYDGAELEA